MSTWISMLGSLGAAVWCAWFWPAFIIDIARDFKREAPPVFRRIRAETRPFALPALLVYYVPDIALHFRWWQLLFFGGNLPGWYFLRKDDDDDRWKRRKEKLAAKVAEVGGRLQVVPDASPT